MKPSHQSKRRSDAQRSPGKAGVVLIVEDEEMASVALVSELAERGVKAQVAMSRSEAVEYATGHPISAVILDLMLPAGGTHDSRDDLLDHPTTYNGLEVLSLLREGAFEKLAGTTRDVPVFVVSAALMDSDLRNTLEDLGVDGFFIKPTLPSVVAETVTSHFSGQRPRKAE